jgi:hypothetical protein
MKDFPRGKPCGCFKWTGGEKVIVEDLTIVFQQLFLELCKGEPVLWGVGAIIIKTHLVQLNPQKKHMHECKHHPEPLS